MMTDYHEFSDEMLLKKSIQNPSLFAVLFDRYESLFLSIATIKLQNAYDAREAVQDTCVNIYKSADTFKGGSFKSWAFRILHNKIIDIARSKKPTVEIQEHHALTIEPTNDSFLHKAIHQALNTLDTVTQRMVRAYYLHDWSQKEIAREYNMSHDSVRQRLSRARKVLRDQLAKHYDA